MLTDYNDYRDYLRTELETRMRNNSRYSLRAFARDLKIAAPNLSLMLKGRKGLSQESASKIARQLSLQDYEASYFCDLVAYGQARTPAAKKIAELRLLKYKIRSSRTLHEDALSVLSGWYHFAILEMTYLKEFKSNSTWISKRLGISVFEVECALDRLKRLGLLVVKGQNYVKANKDLATIDEIPSEALKALNIQLLQKAIEAIRLQTLAERDTTTMTMALDVTKIPEAKKRIRAFQQQLTEYLETGNRTEVYTLSVQLFKITKEI